MIRATYRYFTKEPNIPSAYIDGFLYVAIAFFGSISALLGTDEAAKWINPLWLFIVRGVCNAIAASLLALKMYRSTGFADHIEKKKQDGDTEIRRKLSEPGPVP